MNLGRLNRYSLADAVSGAQMRERTMHLRRRVGSRAMNASHDLPYRLRETKFLLRIGAGIAAVILLFVVYSSSSGPAAPAASPMFSSPAGVVTTKAAPPVTTPASAAGTQAAISLPTAHRAKPTTHVKSAAPASHSSQPRALAAAPAAPAKPATTAPVSNPTTTTVTTPGRTTTTVQTVTVTTPASPPPTPTTTAPASSTPPPGTMTEANFKGLSVGQITRGVITSVFGAPATAKQLQSSLGAAWVKAAAKDLPSGTSCAYYFDRDGKAQTFQLCFDSSNMLSRKQSLTDSTASGSA